MSFLDSAFGGGSQTVKTKLPDYITGPANTISDQLANIVGRPGQQGFNRIQQQGLDSIYGTATQGNPFVQSNTDFLNSLYGSGGLAGDSAGLANYLTTGQFQNPAYAQTAAIAGGSEVGNNPFLEASFNRAADAVGRQFQQNILPNLDNSYAAAGRSGSRAYAQARNNAETDYGNQINDLANQVYGGAYQTDQARRDQALTQLGGYGQQNVNNALAGAGLQQQGIQNLFGAVGASDNVNNQNYDAAQRLFQLGSTIQQQPYQNLNNATSILSRLPYGTSTQQSTSANPFSQLLGLGTGIAGLGTQGGGTVGGDLFSKLFM